MKKYTVILSYPHYLCDNLGDTRVDHVEAECPYGAVRAAQCLAVSENEDSDYDVRIDPEDFAPVSIFEGHLMDLIPEEYCR
jgi:hypothetical protein